MGGTATCPGYGPLIWALTLLLRLWWGLNIGPIALALYVVGIQGFYFGESMLGTPACRMAGWPGLRATERADFPRA